MNINSNTVSVIDGKTNKPLTNFRKACDSNVDNVARLTSNWEASSAIQAELENSIKVQTDLDFYFAESTVYV
jgi:hypothetical protein